MLRTITLKYTKRPAPPSQKGGGEICCHLSRLTPSLMPKTPRWTVRPLGGRGACPGGSTRLSLDDTPLSNLIWARRARRSLPASSSSLPYQQASLSQCCWQSSRRPPRPLPEQPPGTYATHKFSAENGMYACGCRWHRPVFIAWFLSADMRCLGEI